MAPSSKASSHEEAHAQVRYSSGWGGAKSEIF